jgi:hypothetical protein
MTDVPSTGRVALVGQYMEAEYEQAAAVAGMNVAWKSMTATPQALAKEGEEFWRPIHETQPYILLIAQGR